MPTSRSEYKIFEQNRDIIFSKVQQSRLPCVVAGDINNDFLIYSAQPHSTTRSYIDHFFLTIFFL